jgi:hypothetical protein
VDAGRVLGRLLIGPLSLVKARRSKGKKDSSLYWWAYAQALTDFLRPYLATGNKTTRKTKAPSRRNKNKNKKEKKSDFSESRTGTLNLNPNSNYLKRKNWSFVTETNTLDGSFLSLKVLRALIWSRDLTITNYSICLYTIRRRQTRRMSLFFW